MVKLSWHLAEVRAANLDGAGPVLGNCVAWRHDLKIVILFTLVNISLSVPMRNKLCLASLATAMIFELRVKTASFNNLRSHPVSTAAFHCF